MASIINASTSSGLVESADTSGNLELQSNGTTKVAVSSSGVALTGASLTSFAGGAITQATAVASTSGTSIDFTSIPSWAKKITVMFSGVSTSGSSPVQIQLGTGATPTYTTTGYSSYILYNGGTLSSTTGLVTVGASASDVRYGQMIISNLNSNIWVDTTGASVGTNGGAGGGGISLAAALTAIRVTTVNGTDTFDAGSINIMYEG